MCVCVTCLQTEQMQTPAASHFKEGLDAEADSAVVSHTLGLGQSPHTLKIAQIKETVISDGEDDLTEPQRHVKPASV